MKVSSGAKLEPADRIRVLIGVIVGIYWFIAAIGVRERLLGDPDIWWHIKTGMHFWSTGHLPTTDPFSFSFAGQPWIAKEWLSQLIYASAFHFDGWSGVLFVGALGLAIGAAFLFWVVSAWLNPSLAAAIALLGIFIATPAIIIRPHLLTLPIVILWVNAVFSASGRGRAPNLLWLVLILLWANLHAAFTMGLLIAGFAFLDFLEQTRGTNRRGTWGWLVFLALCLLVSLAHPYGYKAMFATLLVVGPNEAVGQINEWQPFNARLHWVQAVALIGLMQIALVSGFRLGIARSLLLAVLTYLFMMHVRYAFFLFPVLAIIIAPPMALQFPRISAAHWRQQPPDRSDRFMSNWFGPLMAAAALVFVGAATFEQLALRTAPPERVSAASAIAFAKENSITGHVFNYHDFGGPLIFNDIATFIDGRTDQLFLDEFVKEYMTGPKTDQRMIETLRKYDIRWSLLPPGDPRAALIEKMPDWRRVYADNYAIIHQRQ